MSFLILACSKVKLQTSEPVPARELYRGAVFKKGRAYAEREGLDLYILSAKYGLISGNTLITDYDEKLKRMYDGSWDLTNGSGYYLGGKLYFGNAPQRIQPLISPGLKYGYMLQALNRLLDDPAPSK